MSFPNPDTQFQPGESGNPAGRPKGSRNLSTILREMLSEEVEIEIEGKKEKCEFQEAIVKQLLRKANKGNLRAIQEIFDRVDGKAKQQVDVTTKGEQITGVTYTVVKPEDD